MIGVLLMAASVESTALSDLYAAVGKCDRSSVSRTFLGEEDRRTRFLVQAFVEQEAISSERSALIERRKRIRLGTVMGDNADRIRADGEALADRQQALDDSRQLERSRQEVVDQVRRQFLSQCGDRGSRNASGTGAP